MARNFLTSINLGKNELQNARIHVLPNAPADPQPGQIYYNSGTNKLYFWNGSAWVDTSVAYQPLDADLTAIAGLGGATGLLKKTALDTWTLDTTAYLVANQTITISGDATGSGTTAISLTLANSGVTAGTYNDSATAVRPFTVDVKGRVTGIGTAVTITPAWGSITGKPTTLSGYGITDAVASSLLGANNGVATLDGTGKVPASQLPAYVDDVREYANLAAMDALAAGDKTTGIIYVAIDTGKVYRWSGTVFVEISPTAGNADTATKLQTARTITATSDISWTVTFDGSANVSAAATLANSGVAAGTYQSATEIRALTVDAKGRVTGVGAAVTIAPAFSSVTGKPTTIAGYGITDAIKKFAANVGNGTLLDYVINHALNTRDVTVQVYTNSGTYATVECDVEMTDANNVTLRFTVAPTTNQYRVVVVG